MELAEPVSLGCLSVVELVTFFRGMQFPVDVSGGVERFRHRRGLLQRIELELQVRDAEAWAAARLAGIFGPLCIDVCLSPRDDGATVCVSGLRDAAEEAKLEPVLAFEALLLVEGEQLLVVIDAARGIGLPGGSMALALACARKLFCPFAARRGAVFSIERGAARLVREIAPLAGARIPSTRGVAWTRVSGSGDGWTLLAVAGGIPFAPSDRALRARELADLLANADDALFADKVEEARELYVSALERAPRHPGIAARIVDIDAQTGVRAEASLGLLNESGMGTSEAVGAAECVRGMLLAEIGKTDAAVECLERYAKWEPSPALSANASTFAASLCDDPEISIRFLDFALARAPRSVAGRWARVGKRLELGMRDDALADVEAIEALAHGRQVKHAVWTRAGRAWQRAGFGGHAGHLFEHALRYIPDDPRAIAGLAIALVEDSEPGDARARRGVALLSRAIALGELQCMPTGSLRLELARCFADHLDDIPMAIAHASRIAPEDSEGGLASGLEGRWRARLGDYGGSSLAFERLREHTASQPKPLPDDRAVLVAELLEEGAKVLGSSLHDLPGAHRLLAVAHDILPRDLRLQTALHDLEERLSGTGKPPQSEEPPSTCPIDPAEASIRVEQLTLRLHADPTQEDVVDELVSLLERLGRNHELLALLCARIDDASAEQRGPRVRRARETFARIARNAELASRIEEASLFRDALASVL
jgi:tetratricopeptide (TPR) repeat protein